MPNQESKTMQEIHQIREELYEEMKDLTIEERLRRIEENALEYIKKRNLKVKLVDKH
jgi:hypothetical protein